MTSVQSGKCIVSSLLSSRRINISQLKEEITSDMLIALSPSLHTLVTICLSIPVSIATVERSFSDMQLNKESPW